ncbi:hypothetical protein AcV5_008701 [Taiwanofungus camphoratus]|nr:hypothetical protein AcV5_008701 [Antrodia cinnamomea]KAI0956253.1 hypothetical protein AcV7_006699 [Antrodia cinnamomea]
MVSLRRTWTAVPQFLRNLWICGPCIMKSSTLPTDSGIEQEFLTHITTTFTSLLSAAVLKFTLWMIEGIAVPIFGVVLCFEDMQASLPFQIWTLNLSTSLIRRTLQFVPELYFHCTLRPPTTVPFQRPLGLISLMPLLSQT